MIHLLLINLSIEASCMVWRAAQYVWKGHATVQAVSFGMAMTMLRHEAPFDQSPCPSLALLATGSQGDWDPTVVRELRGVLTACQVPLVGLADTSWAMERLQARRAPLDAVLLSPVHPEALRELASTLKLDPLQPTTA